MQFKIHGTVWHTPVEKRKKREEGRQAPEPQREAGGTRKSMKEQNPFPEKRKKREGRQAPEPKKREEGRQAPEPQPEPGGTSKS